MNTSDSTIQNLEKELDELTQLVKEQPKKNYFFLTGINHLGHGPWKDNVYTLLSRANVPYFWIIDIVQHQKEPNKATIFLINTLTTHVAISRLRQYLK